MTKPEPKKNTSGKLFDDVLSDDDEVGTSSYIYSSKNSAHEENTPEEEVQAVKIHKGGKDTSPHEDTYLSPKPSVSLPARQSENTTATVPTNFILPEPVKIKGMVFMNDIHTRFSTVDLSINAAKDPASQDSEFVSGGSVFRQKFLDPSSPDAANLKALPSPNKTRELPQPKEVSDHNLDAEAAQNGTSPNMSQPVVIDFPNIHSSGTANAMHVDNLQGFPESRSAAAVSFRSPNSFDTRHANRDRKLSSSLRQAHNDSKRDHSNIPKSAHYAAYIFPRLDASLVDPETQFTRESPPPNCVEACFALLLRVDPRLLVYYVVLLTSIILTLASLFYPQIIRVKDSCYTYWGYKKNCEFISYTVPVLLINSRMIRNTLFVGGILSTIALILYTIAFISVWIYIFCIDKPSRNMEKHIRWRIGCFGFLGFILHCIVWIMIIDLYNRKFTSKNTQKASLGLGFDLSLVACLLHSIGLIFFLFVSYSKIPCIKNSFSARLHC